MSLRAGICALVLAGVSSLQADESASAPLETSKRELSALQKDQAAEKAGSSTGKMRDLLPQFQAPVSTGEVPNVQSAEKIHDLLTRKPDNPKNWLVDGVRHLENESKAKRDHFGRSLEGGDENKADETESGHLLALYDQQRKSADPRKAAGTSVHPTLNDPLRPFLQGWLADSPVRGKFFDDYVSKINTVPADHGLYPATSGALDGGNSGAPVLNVSASDATAVRPPDRQLNPYLAGLDFPAMSSPGKAGGQTILSRPDLPVAVIPPIAPAEPPPLVAPIDQKQPAWVPTDEKKYFPQLKKF